MLAVVTGIVWLVWQHRSQSNLRRQGCGLAFTPGWAVGWWLIPMANLWKPFQATRELHKASAGETVVEGADAGAARLVVGGLDRVQRDGRHGVGLLRRRRHRSAPTWSGTA